MTLAQAAAEYAPNWWLLGTIAVIVFVGAIALLVRLGRHAQNVDIEVQGEAVRRGIGRPGPDVRDT